MTSTSQNQADLSAGRWRCDHPNWIPMVPSDVCPEPVWNNPYHKECWLCQYDPTATSDSRKRAVNSSSDEGYKADEEKKKGKGKGKKKEKESDSDSDRDVGAETEKGKGKGKREKEESDSDRDMKRPKHISNLEKAKDKIQDDAFYQMN